jgi:hypothetical protein
MMVVDIFYCISLFVRVLSGTDVSRITKTPFGFKTLRISFNPLSSVSKWTPKATVIASK